MLNLPVIIEELKKDLSQAEDDLKTSKYGFERSAALKVLKDRDDKVSFAESLLFLHEYQDAKGLV